LNLMTSSCGWWSLEHVGTSSSGKLTAAAAAGDRSSRLIRGVLITGASQNIRRMTTTLFVSTPHRHTLHAIAARSQTQQVDHAINHSRHRALRRDRIRGATVEEIIHASIHAVSVQFSSVYLIPFRQLHDKIQTRIRT